MAFLFEDPVPRFVIDGDLAHAQTSGRIFQAVDEGRNAHAEVVFHRGRHQVGHPEKWMIEVGPRSFSRGSSIRSASFVLTLEKALQVFEERTELAISPLFVLDLHSEHIQEYRDGALKPSTQKNPLMPIAGQEYLLSAYKQRPHRLVGDVDQLGLPALRFAPCGHENEPPRFIGVQHLSADDIQTVIQTNMKIFGLDTDDQNDQGNLARFRPRE